MVMGVVADLSHGLHRATTVLERGFPLRYNVFVAGGAGTAFGVVETEGMDRWFPTPLWLPDRPSDSNGLGMVFQSAETMLGPGDIEGRGRGIRAFWWRKVVCRRSAGMPGFVFGGDVSIARR